MNNIDNIYKKDFALFILSHGRADNVKTYKTLKNCGYTGKIYILCDDEDEQLEKYKQIYGELVHVFSKDDYEKKFDKLDNFSNKKSVIYARNAVYDVAKKLGLKYISVCDDDYDSFRTKINKFNQYKESVIKKNIDTIFKIYLEYLIQSNISCIAFSQGGDFIGGGNGTFIKQNKRKIMNLYFFNLSKPVQFIAKLNDDLTTSLKENIKGNVIFTSPLISLQQSATQQQIGGLTDIYLDYGTYVKSFYSVIYCPSAVKINTMGMNNKRIHHEVRWNNVAPKILRECI